MKISNISENHTNSMNNKLGVIWNYKIIILYYDTFLEKQIQRQIVLSRKDHIDTMEDNKDIQMLKEEMWTRKQITVEIEMIQGNQVVEETTILEEIWRNGTKEQEVINELKKEDG